ncbi:MAG: IS110 family transposase [Chthoniobacteraceae bacterium]
MSCSPVYIGADVAKDSIELFCHELKLPPRISNDPAGWRSLLALLKASPLKVHLVCEATGPYHKPFVRALHRANIPLNVFNPRRVREFAKGSGQLAKTDKLDAKILVAFAQYKQPQPVAPNPLADKLSALSARRQALMEMRSAETKRLAQSDMPLVRRSIQSLIAALSKQIDLFDQRIQKLIADCSQLAPKLQRLCQVDGVGVISASLLLAACPELGSLKRNKIASLAGLAPICHESGKSRGKASIQDGRLSIRRALYMAALSAARCNPVLKPFYLHLRAAGKPFKVAITAVMRKLLIFLNSLAKSSSPALS